MSDLFDHRSTTGYAQVALERGIDISANGLTYAVPEELADLAIGERVIVPLGRQNRPVTGFVIELCKSTTLEESGLKHIASRDGNQISLPPDLIDLARWLAGYYCCPLGMVFASMLPAAVARGTGRTTRILVRIGQSPVEGKLTRLQQAVLDAARHCGPRAWVELKQLANLAGAKSTSPVKQLIRKKCLETKTDQYVVSDLELSGLHEVPPDRPQTLTSPQRQALDQVLAHAEQGFGVHLLHGVTGSGKTEVYLQLIEVLGQRRGRNLGAIVLVPEISLTPQTVARFMARFPDGTVAVLHSGLTAAQRHAQWRRIREGQACLIIGARSAIFGPLSTVDLIIVDEEHDSSYKQDQLPRYHARDVAIKRAQMADIPILLGSATPSLESYHHATLYDQSCHQLEHEPTEDPGLGPKSQSASSSAKYHLIRMPDRVAGLKLPAVQIVDLQDERRQRRGVHLLSRRLEHELDQTLKKHHQAILLLNRRGYANYIACPDHRCGWIMTCEHCDVTSVYHKNKDLPTGGLMRCHHCGAESLLPTTCPLCARRTNVFGLGTQRVEEELRRKFPSARTLRMDSDVMRNSRDYAHSLAAFRTRQIDVLLGTQMIAKGLDFPGVRLVGVISGDTSLHLPDFRCGERTFQLIAQVAGRAGRSHLYTGGGRVIVQSFNPTDPIIGLAACHDYDQFARREIALRAKANLPPITRMARVVVRDMDYVACCERAKTLSARLESFNDQLNTRVCLRGPTACPIARIGGFHRQQIELIAPDATVLQRLLTALRNTRLLISDARTAVDVDPVSLL